MIVNFIRQIIFKPLFNSFSVSIRKEIIRLYYKIRYRLTDAPDETLLRRWAEGEWEEYQRWLDAHALNDLRGWRNLRRQALLISSPPKISIVVPTFNTPPDFFEELVFSVIFQVYPFWELCVVDDGSHDKQFLRFLEILSVTDSRIKIKKCTENRGICLSTNAALDMAEGTYVAFLDHDDRLSPDALYFVAKAIVNTPDVDILYSDRDMLSPRGNRFMHLFKPDWSPETLLSMNYIFHLMVYRKRLLDRIGGMRKAYEGSQDYDLILRAMETNPKVCHIPKVLYQWRQHEVSVALNLESKGYAFSAGINALKNSLERRGLVGDVTEIAHLPRGHYKVSLLPPSPDTYRVIYLNRNGGESFIDIFKEIIHSDKDEAVKYYVFLGNHIKPQDDRTIPELLSWFRIPEVGVVTGKILDENNHVLHGGLVLKPDGTFLSLFKGFPDSEYGYMGAIHIVRNVSVPNPYCFAIRKELISNKLIDPSFTGVHGVTDLAAQILKWGLRIVYSPFNPFICEKKNDYFFDFPENDLAYFSNKWDVWLYEGDPNYNKWLTFDYNDMGLSA